MEPSSEEKARLESPEKPEKNERRRGMSSIVALVVVLLIGALAWGALTQIKLSNSESNLSTTEADLAKTHADLVSTQANLTSTQTDLTNETSALVITTNALSDIQAKLTEMQSKFPPREFANITELENWVYAHVQPSLPSSLNQSYRDALKNQNEAAQDGYILGIDAGCYSCGGAPGYAGIIGWVVNSATVNGTLYFFGPESPEVFSADVQYGVTYFQDSITCPPDNTYSLPLCFDFVAGN